MDWLDEELAARHRRRPIVLHETAPGREDQRVYGGIGNE